MTSRDALLAQAAVLRSAAEVIEALAGQQLAAGDKLTVKQAAVALGCGPSMARHLAASGRIPATKVGRGYSFSAEDVEKFRQRNGLRRVARSA